MPFHVLRDGDLVIYSFRATPPRKRDQPRRSGPYRLPVGSVLLLGDPRKECPVMPSPWRELGETRTW
jgi:hypothetical protein